MPSILPAYVPPASMAVWAAGTLKQTCDLFRPLINPNSDGAGTPGNRGWAVVARGLPFFRDATRNISTPSVMARVLEPSAISVEPGYFLPDAPLADEDVIRDTTPGGLSAGSVFRILGAPARYDAIPVSDASFQFVVLRQMDHPPADLPA